jgi:uncharacterized membrane protein YoaK (UPF0700 family)
VFRHHGSRRTFRHNLQIATLLSFVAGVVNVVGFVSIQRLTTNITGHFAFFVDDVFNLRFFEAAIFFIYILSFFAGAFTSNTLVEIAHKLNNKNKFVLPVAIEIVILALIGLLGSSLFTDRPNTIALALLFAMGMQNSLVTKISDAVVRTTHLTGLITDLGIEVSQLIFFKTPEQRNQLLSNIQLRARIILMFFVGGVFGGLLYAQMRFYTLLIPAMLLLFGLILDSIRLRYYKWKRKS